MGRNIMVKTNEPGIAGFYVRLVGCEIMSLLTSNGVLGPNAVKSCLLSVNPFCLYTWQHTLISERLSQGP
jgi:hypothetical protein